MENNHLWEKAYNKNTFEIKTNKPSVVVERYKNKFNKNDKVLDIGCGNGRNSIYLSSLGCNIDCFDVADLHWVEKLPNDIKNKIYFSKNTTNSFNYEEKKYKSIIIARVLQYLNKEELNNLIDKIHFSLTDDGFVLLSYTSEGGIFNQEKIEVPKFKYTIEEITELLRNKFKEIVVQDGAKQSKNVNYEDNIRSYDIFVTGKM